MKQYDYAIGWIYSLTPRAIQYRIEGPERCVPLARCWYFAYKVDAGDLAKAAVRKIRKVILARTEYAFPTSGIDGSDQSRTLRSVVCMLVRYYIRTMLGKVASKFTRNLPGKLFLPSVCGRYHRISVIGESGKRAGYGKSFSRLITDLQNVSPPQSQSSQDPVQDE